MTKLGIGLLVWFLIDILKTDVINVNDYNAVPFTNTVEAAFANSEAFMNAFDALSLLPNGSSLYFPSEYVYYMMPVSVSNITNKNIIFNSDIFVCDNISAFPHDSNGYYNVFQFNYVSNLVFSGNGFINGQGYDWWERFLINSLDYRRPVK